jgi:cytochrome oxidase assembly protein ShyY1
MLVAVAATVVLGLWQWGVSHDRKDARVAQLAQAAPVPLSSVMGNNDAFPGSAVSKPVTVDGTWQPSGAVWVAADNQSEQATSYWVAEPLQVSGEQSAIYVVVGSLATTTAPTSRPPTLTGTTTVDGWLEASQNSGLDDADPDDDVLPEMRISDLVPRVDTDLYSAFVISKDPAPGLVAAHFTLQPETPFTTGLRNLLYALQWWLFSAFAVFIWWRWLKEQNEVESHSSDAQDDAVASGT